MSAFGAFVVGAILGVPFYNFITFASPYMVRAINAVSDAWCPERPKKGLAHVPSLAETFDDLDAVTAAETLANLRLRKRPDWARCDGPNDDCRPTTAAVEAAAASPAPPVSADETS